MRSPNPKRNTLLAVLTCTVLLDTAPAVPESVERVGPFVVDRTHFPNQAAICTASLLSSSGMLQIAPQGETGFAIIVVPRAGLNGLEDLRTITLRLDQRGYAKEFTAERLPGRFNFLVEPEDMVRLQTLRHVVIVELGEHLLRWPLGGTSLQALVSALNRCAIAR